MKIKLLIFNLFFSLFLCTMVYFVNVYSTTNEHQFIFTWSSHSITHRDHFFIVPFLANVIITYTILWYIFKKFKPIFILKYNLLYFLLMCIYSFYIFTTIINFLVFGFEYSLFKPVHKDTYDYTLYCSYLTFDEEFWYTYDLCGRAD